MAPTPTSTPQPTPTATPVPVPTPTPSLPGVRGGTLTFRAHGTYSTIDPIGPGGLNEFKVVTPMYTRLLSQNAEDEIVPMLATDWTIEGGGTVFTFNLRDDIQFHDGVTVTAEDVAYSFNTTINPPEGLGSRNKSVFAPIIESAEALDPQTARITTKRTSGWFLSHVPINHIVPKHAHEPVAAQGGFQSTGLGSGPFTFESLENGVELVMVRNEDYFKPGLPYLDEIRHVVIEEDEAVIAAFITGRIHHSGSRDFDQTMMDAVTAEREVVINTALRPLIRGFGMNQNHPQLANKRVREALVVAMDERPIVDVAYPGVNLPGTWFPGDFGIPEAERNQYAMFGYGENLEDRLETARQILADEGVNDLQLELLVFPGPYLAASEVIQQLLGRIGVQVDLNITDRAGYKQMSAQGEYDMVYWTGVSPTGEPEHLVAGIWAEGASELGWTGKPHGYSNPQVDQLFADLQNTVDRDARIEITRQIDRIVLDDAAIKFLGWFLTGEVVDSRIKGYATKGDFHPIRILESVWLAPE